VEIGAASHFALLERNRMQLFREVQTFLEIPSSLKTAHGASGDR
jgi:hypothetical protein